MPVSWLAVIVAALVLVIGTVVFLASRYRRCPSDKILVVYGKVAGEKAAKCIHGGGTFVWPLIQDYQYLSLTPMTINIPLSNALSMQNIRIDVPSTFTVGIGTDLEIMNAAAERMLGLSTNEIEQMAKEIIFGQLRLTVASMTIEEINKDREKFFAQIRENVSPELNKIGLHLINVNITDITDESGYIEAQGKKAAADAINQAKIDVAEQDKRGSIGEAEAYRERDVKVAENHAQAEKGKKAAMADQRIFVQQKEAEAVDGENTSKAEIADSNAKLVVREAEARKQGEVADAKSQAEISKAHAIAEKERLTAEEVVPREIEKEKVVIDAEAEAEKKRREAKGEADAVLAKYIAEAEGVKKVLESKAAGYESLVKACGGDPKAAATMLMVEIMPEIVKTQVEAIKGIKIDKVTVWDNGAGGKGGNGGVPGFLAGLAQALPPVHELAEQAGIKLPEVLGEMVKGAPALPAAEVTSQASEVDEERPE